MMQSNKFAKRLKDFRKLANISQEALGELLGFSGSMVSSWESGRRGAKPAKMEEVQRALDRFTLVWRFTERRHSADTWHPTGAWPVRVIAIAKSPETPSGMRFVFVKMANPDETAPAAFERCISVANYQIMWRDNAPILFSHAQLQTIDVVNSTTPLKLPTEPAKRPARIMRAPSAPKTKQVA